VCVVCVFVFDWRPNHKLATPTLTSTPTHQMRINYAPTKGFEKDVGRTTTMDLCNKENTGFLTSGKHRWRNSTLLLFEAHSRIIRKNVYHKLLLSKPVVRFIHSRALPLRGTSPGSLTCLHPNERESASSRASVSAALVVEDVEDAGWSCGPCPARAPIKALK